LLLCLGSDLIARGHEVIDVSPDGLLCRIAEERPGAGIPRRYVPFEIDQCDGHRTRLEQRFVEAPLSLKLADVAVHRVIADRAARDHDRRGDDVDVNEGAVLPGSPGDEVDL